MNAARVEIGWAMLKGLGAAAVLIAICLTLAALHPAHAESSVADLAAFHPDAPVGG